MEKYFHSSVNFPFLKGDSRRTMRDQASTDKNTRTARTSAWRYARRRYIGRGHLSDRVDDSFITGKLARYRALTSFRLSLGFCSLILFLLFLSREWKYIYIYMYMYTLVYFFIASLYTIVLVSSAKSLLKFSSVKVVVFFFPALTMKSRKKEGILSLYFSIITRQRGKHRHGPFIPRILNDLRTLVILTQISEQRRSNVARYSGMTRRRVFRICILMESFYIYRSNIF